MAQSVGSSSQCVIDLNQTNAAVKSDNKIGDSQVDEVDKPKNVDEIELTFRKADKNGDGEIDQEELKELLKQLPEELPIDPKHLAKSIFQRHDANRDGRLDRTEFREVVTTSFIGKRLNVLLENIVPRRRQLTVEDRIQLCPPPLGIFIVSALQIFLFLYDEKHKDPVSDAHRAPVGPMQKVLQYSPESRSEAWRFLTYMFSHSGVLHIVANLFIQLPLGIILEYLNTWWRVMIVYLAGVLSGSLGASIANPQNGLVGASAGDYALLFAFIPNFILNWTEMKNRVLYFLMFSVCFTFLTLPSILNYVADSNTSHVSHLSGAIAGLLVGFVVLTNVKVEPYERKLQKVALLIFGSLISTAILIHVCHPSIFPK